MKQLARRIDSAPLGMRVIVAVVAVLIATSPLRLQGGADAADTSEATATAVKGAMTVTVGGVGRIVSAGSVDALSAPSSQTSTTGTASPDAVFAHTPGHIGAILVRVGQPVRRGQLLAVVNDNGLASSALAQAKMDVAVAALELRQKATSDPATGRRASPAELAAATAAVVAAGTKLKRLHAPATRVETAAAQAELSKALGDLAVLRQAPAGPVAAAVQASRAAIAAATVKLNKVAAAPDAATMAAADADLAKAKADLATIARPATPPLAEELAVAQEAVALAEKRKAAAIALGDPVEIASAQLDLDRANLDLANLMRPKPGPLAEEIAAATAAVESAQQRVNQVRGPRDTAEVAAAQAELARVEADLATLLRTPAPVLKAQMTSARRAVEAARLKLAQLARVNPADIAAAKADLQKAEADRDVLRARGGPATGPEIELARLKLQEAGIRAVAARKAVHALAVRSPRAGTVTSLTTVVGAPVDGSTAIGSVADLKHLEVTVDLSEFDIARVNNGQPAIVGVDALGGKRLRGTVRLAAATGTTQNGVVTFPVRITLRRTPGLRPGMNVSVRIVVAHRNHVLQVPLDAVTQDGDGDPIVSVVTTQGTTERPVTLGLTSSKRVEILGGLKAGDHVQLFAGQTAQEED